MPVLFLRLLAPLYGEKSGYGISETVLGSRPPSKVEGISAAPAGPPYLRWAWEMPGRGVDSRFPLSLFLTGPPAPPFPFPYPRLSSAMSSPPRHARLAPGSRRVMDLVPGV